MTKKRVQIRPYAERKAKDEEKLAARVHMDPEEYNTLVALRDGAHLDLKMAFSRVSQQYQEVLALNSEQLNRVNRQHLEVEHARVCLKRIEDRHELLTVRCAKLEAELAEATLAAAEVVQLRRDLADAKQRIESSYPGVK
jgi:chromosome segregation ATPase